MSVLLRGKSQRLIAAQRGRDKVQKQSRDHDIVGDALEEAKIGLARAGFEPQPVRDEIQTGWYRHGNGYDQRHRFAPGQRSGVDQ
jgi:hypothetical protein